MRGGGTGTGSDGGAVEGEAGGGGAADDEALAARNSRLQERIKRQARTHSLLVSIVIVFAISWFPLNLMNLILDDNPDLIEVFFTVI